MLIIAAAALSLLASPQPPPAPPTVVHFEEPNATEANLSFRCPGRTAAIELEYAAKFTAAGSVITVTKLTNGRYRLRRGELAKVSAQLSQFYSIKGVSIRCAGGGPLIAATFLGSVRTNDGSYRDGTVTVTIDGSAVLEGREGR